MYGTNRTATGAGNSGGSRIPSGYQAGRMQNFTPEMQQLFQHLIGQLGEGGYLSRLAGGDQSLFEEMERPALRQFSGIQGNIASKYSGTGLGARHSSGFQNEMTAAGSDFAQQLQSRRQDLQMQAIRDMQQLGGSLLQQRPFENYLKKEPDFLSQILGGSGDLVDMISKIIPWFKR
jgi:hypothetical protein